jgi:hypothetical protein
LDPTNHDGIPARVNMNPTSYPGPDDPVPNEEITLVRVPFPDDFDEIIYHSEGYEPQYIAAWIKPGISELYLSDGYVTYDGDKFTFNNWDKQVGEVYLERITEDLDKSDLATSSNRTISLTTILAEAGWFIGSSEQPGNAAILFDQSDELVLVGDREHAREFAHRFNDSPDYGMFAEEQYTDIDFDDLKDALNQQDASFDIYDIDDEEYK